MKKILSLTLAVMLLVSAIPTAFAADQDYSLGTAVTVEGAGGEYTVTVPATLTAGQVGTVTAKGYWPKEQTLKVTAPKTIEVTHTETNQKATVNVDFDGIESLGDDLAEMNIPVSISIDKGNTKFGTWTGTIVYNVELLEPADEVGPEGAEVTATYTVGTDIQADEGMTWAEWIESDYNTITAMNYYQGVHCNNAAARGFLFSDNKGINFVYATDVIEQGATYYMMINGNIPAST